MKSELPQDYQPHPLNSSPPFSTPLPPSPLYLWRVLTQSQRLSVFLVLSVGPGENPAQSSSSGSLSEGQGEKPSLSLTYCFPSPPPPTADAPLLPPLLAPWLLSAVRSVPVGKRREEVLGQIITQTTAHVHVDGVHMHSGYTMSDMITPEAEPVALKSAGCLWLTDFEGLHSQHLFVVPQCSSTPVNKMAHSTTIYRKILYGL